jgi:16S rRNA (cytidine1402-2'-O)-methyltransferase
VLKFVPTPIGNLEDISFRALKALEEADVILAEDTRNIKRLLTLFKEKYSIEPRVKSFISYHSHNENSKEFSKEFFQNQNVIYVSDAGMPAVSDPGATLVDFCIKNSIEYDVLSGANALLCAYAMSGFLQTEFIFFGFLNHKRAKRVQQLQRLMSLEFNSILYEAPHRILQLLDEIEEIDKTREIFIAKEISKLHQNSIRGSVASIREKLGSIKGEYVVVITKNSNFSSSSEITKEDILDLDIQKKLKAKLLSKVTNLSVKECYNSLI